MEPNETTAHPNGGRRESINHAEDIDDLRLPPIVPPSNQYLYIYPLHPQFADPYPAALGGHEDESAVVEAVRRNDRNERLSNRVHAGAGERLSAQSHRYDTRMHSLFAHLYERALVSPYRTHAIANASLYLIPYDMTMDCPYGNQHRSDPGCPLAKELTVILNSSIAFRRYRGRDHMLVLSAMVSNYISHYNCATFLLDFCAHCTKITIENTFYDMPPDLERRLHLRKAQEDQRGGDGAAGEWLTEEESAVDMESYRGGIPLSMDTEWVAVPYPSTYHFPRDWDYKTWILGNAKDRNLTAIFIGSTYGPHRLALKRLCDRVPSSMCLWLEIGPSRPFTSNMTSLYRTSVFCLMPPAPTWSRKATLDALLAGCIPVVFNLQILHSLMPWHIDIVTATAASVFFPLDKLMDADTPS
eukprot:gene6322-8078_t